MLRRRLMQTGHDMCQRWTVINTTWSSAFLKGWGIVDPLADYACLKEHSSFIESVYRMLELLNFILKFWFHTLWSNGKL